MLRFKDQFWRMNNSTVLFRSNAFLNWRVCWFLLAFMVSFNAWGLPMTTSQAPAPEKEKTSKLEREHKRQLKFATLLMPRSAKEKDGSTAGKIALWSSLAFLSSVILAFVFSSAAFLNVAGLAFLTALTFGIIALFNRKKSRKTRWFAIIGISSLVLFTVTLLILLSGF